MTFLYSSDILFLCTLGLSMVKNMVISLSEKKIRVCLLKSIEKKIFLYYNIIAGISLKGDGSAAWKSCHSQRYFFSNKILRTSL